MAIQATGEEAEFIARLRAEVADIADVAGHRCVAMVARTIDTPVAWIAVARDFDADLKCPTCRGPDGARARVASAALVARMLSEGDWEGTMSPRLAVIVALAQHALRHAPTVAGLRAMASADSRLRAWGAWASLEGYGGSPTLMAFVLAHHAEAHSAVESLTRSLRALEAATPAPSAASPAPLIQPHRRRCPGHRHRLDGYGSCGS